MPLGCIAYSKCRIRHGFSESIVHAELCAADSVMHLPLQVERDMEALSCVGINSFKFFMAYKGVFQVQHLPQTLHCCSRWSSM